MKMKRCELCKFPARTFCESDQASLCWDCDARVHGANFLVARHSRGLLCHTCQSLTPWRASGSKLGHTISVCERCTGEPRNRQRGEEEEEEEEDSGESGSTDDDDVEIQGADLEDDEGEDDDEDGDNQVVPWSYAPPPPPQPTRSPSSACTSSEESASRFACSDGEFSESMNAVSLKRTRDSAADPRSLLQDGFNRPSCQWNFDGSALTTQVSGCDFYSRHGKYQRTEPSRPAVQSGSRSAAIIKIFNEN